MAGGGDDHIVAHRLEIVDRRAVDLAVGDHRGHVASRMGFTIIGYLFEIGEEVGNHRLQVADSVGPLAVGGL